MPRYQELGLFQYFFSISFAVDSIALWILPTSKDTNSTPCGNCHTTIFAAHCACTCNDSAVSGMSLFWKESCLENKGEGDMIIHISSFSFYIVRLVYGCCTSVKIGILGELDS